MRVLNIELLKPPIPAEARNALLALRQQAPVVHWDIWPAGGSWMLTLREPTKKQIAREIWLPLALGLGAAVWGGFFIGRYVR